MWSMPCERLQSQRCWNGALPQIQGLRPSINILSVSHVVGSPPFMNSTSLESHLAAVELESIIQSFFIAYETFTFIPTENIWIDLKQSVLRAETTMKFYNFIWWQQYGVSYEELVRGERQRSVVDTLPYVSL